LCLSRACLGKSIGFDQLMKCTNGAQKGGQGCFFCTMSSIGSIPSPCSS
jgi:hypothetical protein